MKLSFASKYMYHTATVKGGFSIRPVLLCGDIPKSAEDRLFSLGYDVRRLLPHPALSSPVACHPDMLMTRLPSGKLLIPERYFHLYEAFFSPFRENFVLCDEELSESYPHDTRYNALSIGGKLFGGKALASKLLDCYPEVIRVAQGYTHCSAAVVGKGVITADIPLYRALISHGIPALLISSGHIALKPYDTGFIGGASLTLSDKLTAFFGRIEDHPDHHIMRAFAEQQNATLLSLTHDPLADFGGGYLLKT